MKKAMYHYKESGLDNVWLVNGFRVGQTSYGEAISIEDVAGLHDAIARNLVEKVGGLNAKEVRFMRKELGLSQKSLATLLGSAKVQEMLTRLSELGHKPERPLRLRRATDNGVQEWRVAA